MRARRSKGRVGGRGKTKRTNISNFELLPYSRSIVVHSHTYPNRYRDAAASDADASAALSPRGVGVALATSTPPVGGVPPGLPPVGLPPLLLDIRRRASSDILRCSRLRCCRFRSLLFSTALSASRAVELSFSAATAASCPGDAEAFGVPTAATDRERSSACCFSYAMLCAAIARALSGEEAAELPAPSLGVIGGSGSCARSFRISVDVPVI